MFMVRGLSLNNPANIRHGVSKWRGLSSVQTDKSFCRFDSLEYGVRALICLLRTYVTKYNLCSISEIINRYAPSFENNTSLYINFVCSECNTEPDTPFLSSYLFDLYPHIRIFELCRSICKIETGFDLNSDLFHKAVSLL